MVFKKKKVIKKAKAEKMVTPPNVGVTPPQKGDIGSQLATVTE